MMYVKVVKRFIVTVVGTTEVPQPEALDALTDQVMDELVALESASLKDADVSATLTQGLVDITIVGVADDFDEATVIANSAIRTAIHAAGGHTPKWETPVFSATSASADLVDA